LRRGPHGGRIAGVAAERFGVVCGACEIDERCDRYRVAHGEHVSAAACTGLRFGLDAVGGRHGDAERRERGHPGRHRVHLDQL
jgi:hypothetical protein